MIPGAAPPPARGPGGDMGSYPHEAFQYGLKLYYRALLINPGQVDRLMDALAGYVAAHDDDKSFRNAWAKLHAHIEAKGGTSATGMVGISRDHARALYMELIIQGARRQHILDNGDARQSPRTLAEKKLRLSSAPEAR